VSSRSILINFGQRKTLRGAAHVYAFAVALTSGQHVSGWVPQSAVDPDIARMPTANAPNPNDGEYESDFVLTGGNLADYGSLKVIPGFTDTNGAASDYLVRPGNVLNMLYNLPCMGGVSNDTLPLGARFRRARVEAHAIPLYRPGGQQVVDWLVFVYGQVNGRYGWIARDALTAVPQGAPAPTPPPRGPEPRGPRRAVVEPAGRELLARPRLSQHEHREVGSPEAREGVERVARGRRLPQQRAEGRGLCRRGPAHRRQLHAQQRRPHLERRPGGERHVAHARPGVPAPVAALEVNDADPVRGRAELGVEGRHARVVERQVAARAPPDDHGLGRGAERAAVADGDAEARHGGRGGRPLARLGHHLVVVAAHGAEPTTAHRQGDAGMLYSAPSKRGSARESASGGGWVRGR